MKRESPGRVLKAPSKEKRQQQTAKTLRCWRSKITRRQHDIRPWLKLNSRVGLKITSLWAQIVMFKAIQNALKTWQRALHRLTTVTFSARQRTLQLWQPPRRVQSDHLLNWCTRLKRISYKAGRLQQAIWSLTFRCRESIPWMTPITIQLQITCLKRAFMKWWTLLRPKQAQCSNTEGKCKHTDCILFLRSSP